MPHRYAVVERSERGRHRRGSVAMHQHKVGLRIVKHYLQAFHDLRGDLVQ